MTQRETGWIGWLLAHPVATGLAVAAITLGAMILTATQIRVEGDLATVLEGDSVAYADFQRFEDRFGAPSQDEVWLVETADFGADGALAALQGLVIELSLSEAALGVMSVFSLPDPEPDPDGAATGFLGRSDLAALPDTERLDRLRQAVPMAAHLMAADRSATLISVIPDRSVDPALRQRALAEALSYADPMLTVTPVGLSAIQRTIAAALVQDLAMLLPAVIALCLLVAFWVFRSWRAAVICTLPALVGLAWTAGAAAGLGITVNAILAVAPAVLLVLGIADAIHVYAVVLDHGRTMPLRAAIALGLRQTFPAVLLATVTTVIAFASLRIAGSSTLADLALVGGLGLVLMLIAVVLVVPLSCLALMPGGARREPARFDAVAGAAVGLMRWRRPVAVLSLIALVLLAALQSRSTEGYSITDHIPRNGDLRAALDRVQARMPGSDQMFAVIALPDPAPGLSPEDRARIRAAAAVLYGDAGALPADLDTLPMGNALVQRVLAADHGAFALPVPTDLASDSQALRAQARAIRDDLGAAGLGDVATVTGYTLMSAVDIPALVGELRVSFYVAVGFVTLLAAILLRSLVLALLSLVPNLIPILGVEAALVLAGQPLSLTGAIALTIAFGIAVDATVHLLNRLRLARVDAGHPTRAQVATALREVVPPVMISSLILLAGMGTTVFSAMPGVAVFGALVSAALVLALLADLFLFPSLLAWADRDDGSA